MLISCKSFYTKRSLAETVQTCYSKVQENFLTIFISPLVLKIILFNYILRLNIFHNV